MILELSKKLKQYEDVILIIDNGIPEYVDKFESEGIQVINLRQQSTNSVVYWLFLPYYLIKTYLRLARLPIKDSVVLTTTFPSHFLGYIFSRKTHKKYFAYCFEPFPFFYSLNFMWSSGLLKGILYTTLKIMYSGLDKLSIQKAKEVFTLNKITQKTIKKIYCCDSIVTLMGVDTKHFQNKSDPAIESKYENRVVIVHSTDYSQMKRTDLALRAIALLKERFQNVMLLITTTRPDSSEKKRYEQMVEQLNLNENVEFLNFVDYDDLPVFYSLATCYLSCSYDEMLGTTSSNLPVKEAMACETPAVRSNITSEDVEDGVTGYLVNPTNIKEVAARLETLIEKNEKELKLMGKRARKRIVQEYNWEKVSSIIAEELRLS